MTPAGPDDAPRGAAYDERAGAPRRDDPAHDEAGPVEDLERSARRAAVFGDVLPDATSDERGDGWGDPEPPGTGAGDEWLRGEVPPHHG